jgi:type IV pilus assembly protein PilV
MSAGLDEANAIGGRRPSSLLMRASARCFAGVRHDRGVGMLEYLVALLIFSVGMMGLMSAQLAGKRAGFEATQRSIATALARDILERIRANPGQLDAYLVAGVGDQSGRLPPPALDCVAALCTAAQMAAFDVWQWESQLLGEPEQLGGDNAGGLVSPRGCVRREGGAVSVTISWRGASPHGPAAETTCGESAGPGVPGDAGIATERRHQLAIATFVAG